MKSDPEARLRALEDEEFLLARSVGLLDDLAKQLRQDLALAARAGGAPASSPPALAVFGKTTSQVAPYPTTPAANFEVEPYQFQGTPVAGGVASTSVSPTPGNLPLVAFNGGSVLPPQGTEVLLIQPQPGEYYFEYWG